MANPRDVKKIPLEWTDDQSQPILVSDFRDIVLTIVGSGSAQVLGSVEIPKDPISIPVDFTSASDIDNAYIAVVLADLGVANTYVTTLTATAETKMAEVNTNLLTYISITRSANTLDGFITVCDNS